MISDKHMVFSYGTLKRGFPNHSVLQEAGARFIGACITKYNYPLVIDGKWNIPFLLYLKNFPGSHSIHGELFELNGNGLTHLDEFEGVDRNYYQRNKIKVYIHPEKGTSQLQEAWCYFRCGSPERLVMDSSRFLSSYGPEIIKSYVPVHQRH